MHNVQNIKGPNEIVSFNQNIEHQNQIACFNQTVDKNIKCFEQNIKYFDQNIKCPQQKTGELFVIKKKLTLWAAFLPKCLI